MTKHALHAPSSLGYKEICPSYSSRPGSNAAADEGTRLHECVERGTTEGLPDELALLVLYCLDYRDKVVADMAAPEVMHEVKLSIAGGLTHGTADFLAIDGSRAVLADWKMGRIRVTHPSENAQVAAYALGVFEKFPQVQELTATICQPRLQYLVSHTFTREQDFDALDLRIRTIIRRANRHGANRLCVPFSGCKYCRKQATCPGLMNKVLPLASQYAGLVIPDEIQPANVSDPALMGRMLEVAAIIKPWCEAVRSHATEMALSGQPIPGYHIGYISGKRGVASPSEVFAALPHASGATGEDSPWEGGELPGITAEELLTCCGSLSISALEDFYAAKAKRGHKGSIREALSVWLSERNLVRPGERTETLKKDN